MIEQLRAEARDLRRKAASRPSPTTAAAAPGPDPALVGRGRSADARLHQRRRGSTGLRDGETFYTWQGGIPELRQALARYHARHFGRTFDRGASSSSPVGGMQAIQIAIAGDRPAPATRCSI